MKYKSIYPMNRGLRLMRKAIYHNRAWTRMRGKPRSGFPLYPIPYSTVYYDFTCFGFRKFGRIQQAYAYIDI